MAAKNVVVTYDPGATRNAVLAAIRDAMVSQLGFTEIEDSISGSGFSVLRHDAPAEPLSRMLVKVQAVTHSGVDRIGFTLFASWTPGSPGSGVAPVGFLDISSSSTDARAHRLNLFHGGRFHLDGDTNGNYLFVTSFQGKSYTEIRRNTPTHAFAVCSDDASAAQGNLGVNYGVLFCSYLNGTSPAGPQLSSSNTFASEGMVWVPPKNAKGLAAATGTSFSPTTDHFYDATPIIPRFIDALNTFMPIAGQDAITQFGVAPTRGRQAYPIAIGNTHNLLKTNSSSINRVSTAAYGVRGFAKGLLMFGGPMPSTDPIGERQVVTVGGVDYVAVVGPGSTRSKYYNLLVRKAA